MGFIKQIILISYQLLFSYLLISAYNFDLQKILKDYLSIAYLVGYVAVFQFFLVRLGFTNIASLSFLGFDLGNFIAGGGSRIQSWFEEPSFLVYALTPAMFIALSRIFKLNFFISISKAFFILLIIFLSKSSIGLFGMLISIIIIIFSKYPIIKKPIYLGSLILIIPCLVFYLYQQPYVKFRVDDTIHLFFDESVTSSDIDRTNLSTYALYSNYKITKEVFIHNPIFGGGFGTYESHYDKHINFLVPKSKIRDMYPLNKKDANSLFFRLLAESGLLGFSLFLYFVFKNRIKFSISENQDERFFWIFSNGIFVLIILRLFRQGHYSSLGFIMFLLLFYFIRKETRFINERNK